MCASAATPGHDAGPGDISEGRQAPQVPRHGRWRDPGISLGYAVSASNSVTPFPQSSRPYSLRRFLNRCAHRDRGFARAGYRRSQDVENYAAEA